MARGRYDNMTDAEFQDILAELVFENAGELMSIPGAYEVFSEHFNNEVLDRWEENNPDKIIRDPDDPDDAAYLEEEGA